MRGPTATPHRRFFCHGATWSDIWLPNWLVNRHSSPRKNLENPAILGLMSFPTRGNDCPVGESRCPRRRRIKEKHHVREEVEVEKTQPVERDQRGAPAAIA